MLVSKASLSIECLILSIYLMNEPSPDLRCDFSVGVPRYEIFG